MSDRLSFEAITPWLGLIMALYHENHDDYLNWIINISHQHVDECDSRYVAKLSGALNELDPR